MRQVYDYTLLECFHKGQWQDIHMGVHATRNQEVALINEISKDGPLDDALFGQLTHRLTNLAFSNDDGVYTLISLYHEGMPLSTYLHNYQPETDHRLTLVNKLLAKLDAYAGLPPSYITLFIHPNQIIVSDEDIKLNEILNLDKLDATADFHETLGDILTQLLSGADHATARAASTYLTSDLYRQNNDFHAVIEHLVQLLADEGEPAAVSAEIEPAVANPDAPSNDAVPPALTAGFSLRNAKPSEAYDGLKSDVAHGGGDEAEQYNTPTARTETSAIPSFFKLKEDRDDSAVATDTSSMTPDTDNRDDADDEPQVEPEQITTPELSQITYTLESRQSEPAAVTTAPPPTRRHKPRKTRAQRRRRLLWLALILLALVLLWLVRMQMTTSGNKRQVMGFQVFQLTDNWLLDSQLSDDTTHVKWTISLDGAVIHTSTEPDTRFKPIQQGTYDITLSVVNADGTTSQPYRKRIAYSEKQALIVEQPNDIHYQNVELASGEQLESTHAPSATLPEDSRPGTIEDDVSQQQFGHAAKRITRPSGQYYKLATMENKSIQDGDTLSLWLKASDDKKITLMLTGYRGDQVAYEDTIDFTPSRDAFAMCLYTFKAGPFDRVDVDIQSDNDYVWFQKLIIEGLK